MAHSGVLEELQKDPRAGTKYLEQQFDSMQYGCHINGILYYVLNHPEKRQSVLNRDFIDAFWRVVLDPERYDLLDAESDDIAIMPYDVVSRSTIACIYELIV